MLNRSQVPSIAVRRHYSSATTCKVPSSTVGSTTALGGYTCNCAHVLHSGEMENLPWALGINGGARMFHWCSASNLQPPKIPISFSLLLTTLTSTPHTRLARKEYQVRKIDVELVGGLSHYILGHCPGTADFQAETVRKCAARPTRSHSPSSFISAYSYLYY